MNTQFFVMADHCINLESLMYFKKDESSIFGASRFYIVIYMQGCVVPISISYTDKDERDLNFTALTKFVLED